MAGSESSGPGVVPDDAISNGDTSPDTAENSGVRAAIAEIDPGESVKRKPGRPRKTDPAKKRDYAAENARRRDRQAAKSAETAKNPVNVKAEPVNVAGLETILYSLHAFAASLIPEMELDKSEAHQLAQAVATVNAHYDTRLDPKILAWINLTTVCAGIYAPRVVAFGLRRKTEKPKAAPLRAVPPNANMAQATKEPEPKPPMSTTLKTAYSDPMLVPDIGETDA